VSTQDLINGGEYIAASEAAKEAMQMRRLTAFTTMIVNFSSSSI
jgi:hypothetical protein